MKARTRGILIGMGGFMAGGIAAAAADWAPLPRAAVAAGVCAVASLLLWLLLPSRTDHNESEPGRGGP